MRHSETQDAYVIKTILNHDEFKDEKRAHETIPPYQHQPKPNLNLIYHELEPFIWQALEYNPADRPTSTELQKKIIISYQDNKKNV